MVNLLTEYETVIAYNVLIKNVPFSVCTIHKYPLISLNERKLTRK